MGKPTSGLAWYNHMMGEEVFNLEHLHPTLWEITIPAKGKNPERNLMVSVSYSLHCFTRREKEDETVAEDAWYSDSRESRVFDGERWALSKYLPEIIATLEKRRCLHTKHEEFVTVEILHEERTIEYAVFFTVTKSGKAGVDLNLFVNSAYERAESIKHKKPIRFHVILLNRYLGKVIKPPP